MEEDKKDDIRKVLGKECEVEKIMMFFREMGMFEENIKMMTDS